MGNVLAPSCPTGRQTVCKPSLVPHVRGEFLQHVGCNHTATDIHPSTYPPFFLCNHKTMGC